MKQKDLALVAVVVFVSAIISLFVSKALFASPKNRQQPVEQVDSISDTFTAPDNHYFNTSSVDPTQLIQIGNNSNTDPFNAR